MTEPERSLPVRPQRARGAESSPPRPEPGVRWVREATAGLILLVLFFGLASPAPATPTVTLNAKAIPIAGFPGTGDLLGAGFEAEVEVTIGGTEYGGFPSPLIGLNVFAPAGVKVAPTGFPTCAPLALEVSGATACARRSSAGPQGVGFGVVSFGGELVPEKVSIKQFFAPGGGLTFYVEGNTPSSFQFLEPSHWTTASAPFGPELIVEVPLIETTPGADDASVTSFKVKVGAAYRRGGRTISYLTQPKRCPRGGFPVKLELSFLSGETVPVADTVPCPPFAKGAGNR
jgi:hypothetical protein